MNEDLPLKLGKKPARPEAVSFKFANYVDLAVLPKPPRRFGHIDLMGSVRWGMLGNDRWGDCVLAGAAHETMVWNREAGRTVDFDDQAVLADYGAVTGFNPNQPWTDQGTDMKDAASYRRKVGVRDASGQRHQILSYLALEPGDVRQLYVASYLFGAVGMGFLFPSSAMDQFNRGRMWTPSNAPIEGGHYVSVVVKRAHMECVTWGRLQPFTLAFYEKYTDEALVYLSEERLDGLTGRSLEGFDREQLLADLNALGAQR